MNQSADNSIDSLGQDDDSINDKDNMSEKEDIDQQSNQNLGSKLFPKVKAKEKTSGLTAQLKVSNRYEEVSSTEDKVSKSRNERESNLYTGQSSD